MGDLVNHAGIHKQLGVIPVNPHDRVAVEVEARLARVAVQHMIADGATVFPFPGPDPLALFQPRAVLGANVIMAPVAAARRQVQRAGQTLVHAGSVGHPSLGPGAVGDSLGERLDVLPVEQQSRMRRPRPDILPRSTGHIRWTGKRQDQQPQTRRSSGAEKAEFSRAGTHGRLWLGQRLLESTLIGTRAELIGGAYRVTTFKAPLHPPFG